jgi:hypothetical protein
MWCVDLRNSLEACATYFAVLGDKSALEVEDDVGAFNAATGQRLVGSHIRVQRDESYLRIEIPPLRLLDPEVVYVLASSPDSRRLRCSPHTSTTSLSVPLGVRLQVRRHIRQHVVGVHHCVDHERCAPGCVACRAPFCCSCRAMRSNCSTRLPPR